MRRAAVLALLVAALLPATAAAAGRPRAVALSGSVSTISADGGVAAAKIAYRSGAKTCNAAVVWQTAGNRLRQLGPSVCTGRGSNDENFDSLTIAGSRVVWADYEFGNNGYCVAMATATLARPKPTDLGVCDGTEGDQYYDFAGNGPLLVTRQYTQCELDCAPDYSGTYQDSITLYQVTGRLTKIGALKRNTQLADVDAGRLLLRRGASLEVVTPNQGANALYITGQKSFGKAFLSGGEVVGVAGTTLTRYDAATGKQTLTRSLPAGSKIADFAEGIVLYTAGRSIHVLRLGDGRDRTAVTVSGLVAARLDSSGLFYGYDVAGGGPKPGRLAFIPFSAVTRLLGG